MFVYDIVTVVVLVDYRVEQVVNDFILKDQIIVLYLEIFYNILLVNMEDIEELFIIVKREKI